jgi:CRISPR/Cas system CSM-associated protein Csm2 small subunit
LCYALCANASSSELRKSTGLHQLNDVLNKDNHIQKNKSDKIKELKSDIAELNHLLKYTIRQSVQEVISTEINTILAEIVYKKSRVNKCQWKRSGPK